MMPRPSQVGHVSENDSTRPEDTRLRVTCIRPRGPISNTCDRVLSTARAAPMGPPSDPRRPPVADRAWATYGVTALSVVLLKKLVDDVAPGSPADVAQSEL